MAGTDSATTTLAGRGGQLWLVVGLACILFCTRLGATKLWDRDEPRNARCAWEMWERGDWVVPTFNGELRTHKPILLYWAMMLSYQLLGVNEFSARLPSALFSVGTVLLTCRLGRRLGNDRQAVWAGVILCTSLMFNVAAHAATPDAALIFCQTLAFYGLVQMVAVERWSASTATRSELCHQRRGAVVAGVGMGLALLAKGPVGLVLPLATWVAFLVWALPIAVDAKAPSWRMGLARLQPRHLWHASRAIPVLTLLAIPLAIALPWYSLVGVRTSGVWLREFFLEHNVGRAMRPMEGHEGPALLFYPMALLIGTFPWSVWAGPGIVWTWRRGLPHGFSLADRFLFAWVGIFVAAFSCASTKLPSYVTPTHPALALLLGRCLAELTERREPLADGWPRAAAATLAGIGLALGIGLSVGAAHYLPHEVWLGAVAAIPLCGGIVAWHHFRHLRIRSGAQVFAGTAALLSLAVWTVVAPRVATYQQIEALVATELPDSGAPTHAVSAGADRVAPAGAEAEPSHALASWGVHEPSWVFYGGRTIPLLDGSRIDLALQQLALPQGKLITSRSRWEQLRPYLGPELLIQRSIPYFLKQDELVLIGRDVVDSPQATAAIRPGIGR